MDRDIIEVDFTRDFDPAIWTPRVQGVDVVINSVGVFRQRRTGELADIHERAPRALFEAAAAAGVGLVMQISALGADAGARSRFHQTKRAADELLRALPVRSVILQPSLVFGTDGASSRQLLMLASLPLIPIWTGATAAVQPVHVEDLVEATVRLVNEPPAMNLTVAVVGPQPLSFRAYLAALRQGLGLAQPRFLMLPRWVMLTGAGLTGLLNRRAHVGGDALEMLERGNAASPTGLCAVLGHMPRAVATFIPPAYRGPLADRAALDWTLPLLRASIALLWIVTGLLSLGLFPRQDSYALLAQVGVPASSHALLLNGAAVLDIALGIGVFIHRWRTAAWLAQLGVMLGYMLIITWWLPSWWLHPFAPILKNVPLAAATLLLLILERTRR